MCSLDMITEYRYIIEYKYVNIWSNLKLSI